VPSHQKPCELSKTVEPNPSPDTLAILLGASHWPDLGISGGEQFSNSFHDFQAYLRNQNGLALPDSHIFSEFDKASSVGTVTSGIIDFLRRHRTNEGQRIRTVLLYLLGQGEYSDEFYFAMSSSRKNQYQTTFFSAKGISQLLLEEARPCSHYVIIDTCHAGAAANILWKSPRGACLLCSSRANELSQSIDNSSSNHVRTQFSGAFLDILMNGESDKSASDQGSSRLSFEALGALLGQRVRALHGPKAVLPEVRAAGGPRLEAIAWLPVVSSVANGNPVREVPIGAIEPMFATAQVDHPVQNRDALSLWNEKLAYLQKEEVIIYSPAQKFSILKQIEHAKKKIQELSE
jgi:hypothetical protein